MEVKWRRPDSNSSIAMNLIYFIRQQIIVLAFVEWLVLIWDCASGNEYKSSHSNGYTFWEYAPLSLEIKITSKYSFFFFFLFAYLLSKPSHAYES